MNILKSGNDLFKIINGGILFLFIVLKYVFVFILLLLFFLTISRLRGIYVHERLRDLDEENNQLKKPRLILSCIYIFLALGILFNFFLYFLLFLSFFWPPPLIFEIYNSIVPTSYKIDVLLNNNNSEYQFVDTIFLIIALASFEAFLHLILTMYYLVNNNKNISNPRKVIYNLIWSIFAATLFGLTFVPFFLMY